MRKRNNPIVKNDLLLIDGAAAPGASNAVRVGSQRWYAWLADNSGFIFKGSAGHFTARREMRRGIPYWYAYCRRGGKLFKLYLGKSAGLTQERLEHAGARMSGQPTRPRLLSQSDSAEWMTALNNPPAAPIVSTEETGTDLTFLPLTKIHPPALPQKLIARPRLTQRINAPITLLVAPSGSGKSTLLNEWRQTCGIPVAWVSLDADDDHPLRFWSTVTAALQTVHPDFGQDLQLHLRPPSPADLSEIVISLTNAIVRITGAPDSFPRLGLVLDDYHHIQDKEIHASLQVWLEHLPSALQLVVSSHTKPPLTLGHLRAKGMVTELETEDLRFTLEEGIGFLSQHTQKHLLAYSDMQSLVKHTEGWVTGLTLATLALTQPGDRRQFLVAFSGAHAYLREYFIESVLSRQPSYVQEFLLKTAILKHLTGPLCDAVTGRTDGTEMLSRLWQENLFLVRMEEPNWYRYHDLFAETLCSQLQLQFTTEIPHLHRQSAEWYRTQNAPDDAVHHLLAIEAWEEAASLIENMALRELEQFGNYSRLLRWLQQLPETVVQQHKTLLRVYVRVAALALSRTEVKQFLTRIEMNITRKPTTEQTTDEQSVLVEIQRIRHFWMTNGSGLSPLSTEGEHDDVWHMLDGIVQYARYVRRDSDKAESLARELYEMAQSRRHLYVMLIAGGGLALHVLLQGHLRRGEKIAHQVLKQAIAQRGKLPEPAGVALIVLSRACYERNQLAQAHQFLLRATEVDPNPSSSNMPIMEAIQRAKIQFAQGDGAAALATIQAARELQAKHPSGVYRDRDLIAYQAWLCLRQGDCAGAELGLGEAGESEIHALSALVRAELLLEQNQAAAATGLLYDLIRQYPQGLYLESILGARVLLALALYEQHQFNQARHVMAEAVRLASPETFLRPFLDHGRQSVPLLTLVLHTSNLTPETQDFVRQVLRVLGHAGGAQKSLLKTELTALSTAASITAREQQVLRLVSAGLSNREIATQLSFTESTVKTHLKNIYRKLGVHSRTQAVAQAQALN
ncbi:MAG TPA: LuxR C-terminal-related transcriptional regulator [Terriglobales bacterium]